jgi:hypothetical protein
MKEILLEAPDNQLDASMKPLIEKWSTPPKAIEILEVLDWCIFGALASGLVVTLLQNMYYDALKVEGISHEEMEKLAVWRRKSMGDTEPEPKSRGEWPTDSKAIIEIPITNESPCELPEGCGLLWSFTSFFGARGYDLNALITKDGKPGGLNKVGWITELLDKDDKVYWMAFDNRDLEKGCKPIVKIGTLDECSRGLIQLISPNMLGPLEPHEKFVGT